MIALYDTFEKQNSKISIFLSTIGNAGKNISAFFGAKRLSKIVCKTRRERRVLKICFIM